MLQQMMTRDQLNQVINKKNKTINFYYLVISLNNPKKAYSGGGITIA